MSDVGTTHHVKVGSHYYMVKPGSYQKRAAPTFGARFSTGDPDFNNLSIWQHWAQSCWIGGVDAPLWADDAMFDDSIGIDSTIHEQFSLGRALYPGEGDDWTASMGEDAGGAGGTFVIYNNTLYWVTFSTGGEASTLWKYVPADDGWVENAVFKTRDLAARCAGTFAGKFFIGGTDISATHPKLLYSSGALTSWPKTANPFKITAPSDAVRSLKSFQGKLYACFGTKIFRLTNKLKWDGNTVFYQANQNSDSNYIHKMEVHAGFLYMLSRNAHLHRSDGNTTFDMWSWDGGTYGQAIRSFDGRLFILTHEYAADDTLGYGSLYQMSGSAMTLLKRWGKEDKSTIINSMTVYDRKLFYGASNLLGFGDGAEGFGVAVYDPIEDAHSIIASNQDTETYPTGDTGGDSTVLDQTFFQGNMYVAVYGHGIFKTRWVPLDKKHGLAVYDTSANGSELAAQNGGWLATSTYDAGTPGLNKLWQKISIDYVNPSGCGIVLEYSIDNGESYHVISEISGTTVRRSRDFWLQNVISTSIKLRITLRSTDATKTPTVYAYVASYIPVPEPDWLWTFTIVLADKMQLLDGTVETLVPQDEIDYLGALFRCKRLIRFKDAEGIDWSIDGLPGVLIYDMSVLLKDLNQTIEGEVILTLLEAVEDYDPETGTQVECPDEGAGGVIFDAGIDGNYPVHWYYVASSAAFAASEGVTWTANTRLRAGSLTFQDGAWWGLYPQYSLTTGPDVPDWASIEAGDYISDGGAYWQRFDESWTPASALEGYVLNGHTFTPIGGVGSSTDVIYIEVDDNIYVAEVDPSFETSETQPEFRFAPCCGQDAFIMRDDDVWTWFPYVAGTVTGVYYEWDGDSYLPGVPLVAGDDFIEDNPADGAIAIPLSVNEEDYIDFSYTPDTDECTVGGGLTTCEDE